MKFVLVPHPQHAPTRVRGVTVEVLERDVALALRWRVEGAQALVLPPHEPEATRADGLWRTTCFELFLRPDGGTAYAEFNFSPSGHWNAYDFSACREGMSPRPMTRAPAVSTRVERDVLTFGAAVEPAALPCAAAITAVLEEEGGVKSYWALAHAENCPPDFHAAAGFAARLPSSRP